MGKNMAGGKGASPMISLRVRPNLYDALVKAAKKQGRSLSDFIRVALESAVKEGK